MNRQLLLDTDILSSLMRKNEKVIEKAYNYLLEHKIFIFSVITKYEILRGLKSKNAIKQIERFLSFCNKCYIFPVDDRIVIRASDIYAELLKQGKIISDADILIGSTAREYDYGLVTNNIEHFNRIRGLTLENWL